MLPPPSTRTLQQPRFCTLLTPPEEQRGVVTQFWGMRMDAASTRMAIGGDNNGETETMFRRTTGGGRKAVTAITANDARGLLGYQGLWGGEGPDRFTTALITAILNADPDNRARLRLVFPGMVEAFESQDSSWESFEALQAIAHGKD